MYMTQLPGSTHPPRISQLKYSEKKEQLSQIKYKRIQNKTQIHIKTYIIQQVGQNFALLFG